MGARAARTLARLEIHSFPTAGKKTVDRRRGRVQSIRGAAGVPLVVSNARGADSLKLSFEHVELRVA